MTGATKGAMTRPRLSIRLLALLSIGLNLFFGAMLVSGWHNRPSQPGAGMPFPDRMVERAAAGMTKHDAERLRAAFGAIRPRFQELEEDYRQNVDRVRAASLRDPLDPQEMKGLMDTARDSRRRMGDLIEETLLTVMPELSPSGRALLLAGGRR